MATSEVRTRFHSPAPATSSPDAALSPAAIRHVLFPSDLSRASDQAFDHARLIAEAFAAEVTLYHIVAAGPEFDFKEPQQPELERLRRAERAARAHLDRQAGTLTTPNRVIVERTSSPPEALVAVVQALGPDLTVMATHGRTGLAQLVVGNLTERVVRQARIPVLCVREPDHGVALPYRRVLVPTDLSPASQRAFPLGALLARRFDAQVLALHVAAPPRPVSLSGLPDFVENQIPSEQALAAFLEPAFQGVEVAVRVELDSAWTRIVETARSERTDLIVMSTHGHDSLGDKLMGSHTERVVRHAPCPVLVV